MNARWNHIAVGEGDIERELEAFQQLQQIQDMDKHELRKRTPILSGLLMYFPDACAEIAQCSLIGNEQHNPGTELHWDRSKSADELDALTRHIMEAGTLDDDGIRHSTKAAWRSLANLQKEIEADQ